ncbi:MAG: pilus assembly protein [Actinomycetales bacterium]|nr:pilus assembly protein [Actinomycetales bacterium]
MNRRSRAWRWRRAALRSERGSAPAEFAMVAGLLTVLTLVVIQLGLALHVRNTVLDAAAEGARYGALADNGPADAVARTRELIAAAVGPQYGEDVSVAAGSWQGVPALTVTVRTTLPLIGLLGVDRAMEVSGHAAIETLG